LVAVQASKGVVNTSAMSGANGVSLEGDTLVDISEDGDVREEHAEDAEVNEILGTGNRVLDKVKTPVIRRL
jgi:hypothetical protein